MKGLIVFEENAMFTYKHFRNEWKCIFMTYSQLVARPTHVNSLTMPRGVQISVATQEASVQSMLFITLTASAWHVKVQDKELGFLGAVARANSTDEFGRRSPNAPDHSARSTGTQLHEVADELAGTHVPQLHCSVVRWCDHEPIAWLQTSHGRLVLIRPWKWKDVIFLL